MDIYVVPTGPERYELYCEVEDRHPTFPAEGARSWRQRASGVFRRGLAYIEAERRQRLARATAAESRTPVQRVRDRVMGWLAERVAEQRLLWHLRSQTAVKAYHPDDLSSSDAEIVVRRSLRTDARSHLAWMIVDALIYVASLPLTPLPGPNVVAIYFSFRAVGHLLSWLGARNGLREVQWRYASCAPLTTLRRVPAMSHPSREAFVHNVAEQLALRHLDTFVERIALGRP